MRHNLKLSLVIPCYNEEDGVREVIGRCPADVDEIVVVDNNCTDRTAEVARSLGAQVVIKALDAGAMLGITPVSATAVLRSEVAA